MAVRDAVAKYRPPLLHGAALAAAGALLGLLVAVVALVLPNETRRGYLLALTSGPGLTHVIVMKGQEASEVVHAGWDAPLVAASWPSSGDPVRPGGEVRVRAPLFLVTTLWGLALGLLLSLLWQSTASRAPIVGGFVAGALAGLALAFAIVAHPPHLGTWWAAGVSGLPGYKTFLENDVFDENVVERRLVVKSGSREVLRIEEADLARADGGNVSSSRDVVILPGAGIVTLACVVGLLGVGLGLLVAGLRRSTRPLAIVPLGVGLGLSLFLVLPFMPRAPAERILDALASLPSVARTDTGLVLGGVQLTRPPPVAIGALTATTVGPRVEAALLPVLVAAFLLLATPVVLVTSAVASARARSRERARRLEEERRLAEEEAERLRPVEPIPVLPDDRLRPGD